MPEKVCCYFLPSCWWWDSFKTGQCLIFLCKWKTCLHFSKSTFFALLLYCCCCCCLVFERETKRWQKLSWSGLYLEIFRAIMRNVHTLSKKMYNTMLKREIQPCEPWNSAANWQQTDLKREKDPSVHQRCIQVLIFWNII